MIGRMVAVVLALVAVLVAGGADAGAKPSPTTTTNVPVIARKYSPGECLTWAAHRAWMQNSRTVPCAEPHIMEMTGTNARIPARRYPAKGEWGDIVKSACEPKVTEYLGQPLDPASRYYPDAFVPAKRWWKRGLHAVSCGISGHQYLAGERNALIGRVHLDDQAALGTAGTCLAVKHKQGPFSIDCRAPHYAEIAGVVNLDGRFDPAPSTDEVRASAQPECDDLAQRYLGRA